MLSISIRYGGKLSYAMRALCPMLGSNSSQTETALSQMLGHDGARRHTLLSKMLRHNSTRTQNHSDTSIGLRQRSCAAVCDMFPGKNHGSHFTTIKSIGKTHHPVPLRFAVNGSASARYASLPSTLATPWCRDGRAARQRPRFTRQPSTSTPRSARWPSSTSTPCSMRWPSRPPNPAAPGQQQHPRPHLLMLRPLRRHSCQRRHRHPKPHSTALPRAPRHRRGRLTWAEHGNNHLSFACAAEGS